MTEKTRMLPAAAVAASLPPAAVAGVSAQAGPGEGARAPYQLDDIEHPFAVMEDYVVYDRNKNIAFDTSRALGDDSVSRTDIDIALDFAAYSNSIMNAAVGPVALANEAEIGDTELERAVRSLEEGRFRLLFGEDAGPVTVNDAPRGLAKPASPLYEAAGAGAHAPRRGGGGMSDPHTWRAALPWPPRNRQFANVASAHSWATEDGYHIVPYYATGHFPKDYARIDTSAPGDCNSGPFREQAIMKAKSTGTRFDTQHDEPNPELLSYAWPRLWWGSYTYWWHVTDGGTKSS